VNPDIAAALARYGEEPAARRLLRARRRDHVATGDRLEVAQALTAAGHHRGAALWLAAMHRRDPASAPVAYRLGNALRMAGKSRAADPVLEAVCRKHPAWAEPAHSLAWLRRQRGDAAGAAAALERWQRACGDDSRVLLSTSGFLQDMGLGERAESVLAASPRASREPGLMAERAGLLLKLGRFGDAEGLLREAVGRAPGLGGAWLRLAQVRRWETPEDSPLGLMRAALTRPGLDEPTRAAIAFAAAKVEDDLGHYGEAWQTATTANGLRARSARFDRADWTRYETALRRVFAPGCIPEQGDDEGPAPVFIVGMPRSGTTLVERRLGRHPALVPAGELELVERLGIELAGASGYPDGLARLAPEAFAAAAAQWRARLPAALPGAADVIDKNPLNFLHLGLIARLFPRARIVHCRRDPLDTALSLWFQNFAHARNDYAYRAADIAWMYALYRRVMDFWNEILPRPVHTIDYESLVAAPEEALRRLAAKLGLAWTPAMLESGGGDGTIATASLWQARQPVYRGSAGRSRRYARWIAPLREALEREGIAAGG